MTPDEFETELTKDISWRKKEISELYLLAQNHNSEVLLKSLILLLYAHWEGFIKRSSKLYLKYVSDKNLQLTTLEINFNAVALKKHVKQCIESGNAFTIEHVLDLIEFQNKDRKKFKIAVDLNDSKENSLINTGHNLKETVLRSIYKVTGLQYKQSLQTKKICIDNHLLANRNAIAHGDIFRDELQEEFALTLEDINKLKMTILVILDSIKEDLSVYVTKEYYLSAMATEKASYEQLKELELAKLFKGIEDQFTKTA